MIKAYVLSVIVTLIFSLTDFRNPGQVEVGSFQDDGKYSNPVVSYSLPDPTVIKASDGFFYLYATEDIRNTPIHKSSDLVNWTLIGTAFTAETRPVFEPKGGIWAPDINIIGGKYVLYYSMSVWGGEMTCGIGVAVSDKPEGPFKDLGKLMRSNEIGVQNSSTGTCCEGVNSTYKTVVGRSDRLFGPYLDKDSKSMSDNSHEILISGNDRFVGTGHNSEIVEDQMGKTWILYHAIDKTKPKGRVLMLDEVKWKDEWPFVENNGPSLNYFKPVF